MGDILSLRISTLGGLSICLDSETVTGLASRKVEALLVYLACNPRQHPRETLAEMFWQERAQARAMSNLRVALSSLRKHLEPFVVITRDTVQLDPQAKVWLDVSELEGMLGAGEAEEAVALYQGDSLEGFFVRGCASFEDWASVERERLHHTVLDALEGLVESTVAQGRFQDGIGYASQMLQLDPLAESAHRQLMSLLAQLSVGG
jgi:DNA-binding SARP family transcriptional activator